MVTCTNNADQVNSGSPKAVTYRSSGISFATSGTDQETTAFNVGCSGSCSNSGTETNSGSPTAISIGGRDISDASAFIQQESSQSNIGGGSSAEAEDTSTDPEVPAQERPQKQQQLIQKGRENQ